MTISKSEIYSPTGASMLEQSRDFDPTRSESSANGSHSDFSELIERAKAGDSLSVNLLWEQCRKYLLTIANHDLAAPLLQKFGASDVVQQSMIIANEKLPDFQGSSRAEFLAWMKQIVIFECRQSTRRYRNTRKRSIARERSTSDDSVEDQRGMQVADPHLTPRASVQQDEESELIREALLKLTPTHRQVIQLRNWEELTFEQIGLRIKKTPDAARKLWARAIEKLEQELKRMNAI